MFTMTLTRGGIRENHVTEFEEGRRIAWMPAESGQGPPGHLWRWELEPIGASRTQVTCTYDWTQLTDWNRLPRAQATTAGQAPGLARPARGPRRNTRTARRARGGGGKTARPARAAFP